MSDTSVLLHQTDRLMDITGYAILLGLLSVRRCDEGGDGGDDALVVVMVVLVTVAAMGVMILIPQ